MILLKKFEVRILIYIDRKVCLSILQAPKSLSTSSNIKHVTECVPLTGNNNDTTIVTVKKEKTGEPKGKD